MSAVPNSFDTFLENIRLTKELRDACRDAHTDLRKRLLADPWLEPIFVSMFLQGSYARHTGTKPFGDDTHVDVDLVVVTNLDPDALENSPDAVLARFRPFLDREYPKQWEPHDRSFKISPIGSPVTLDLVVTTARSEIQREAFRELREADAPEFTFEIRGDAESQPLRVREVADRISKAFGGDWQKEPLLIPSRDLKRWLPTHPLEQIRWTQAKNERTDGHYVDVVKAIRWWRKLNPEGEYPKSYPLEHFVGDMCPDNLSSVAEGITAVFEKIRQTQSPNQLPDGVPFLADRGVPSNNVFKRITPEQYQTFWRLAADAAVKARSALDADTNRESVTQWRKLLGAEFPPPPDAPFTPPTTSSKPSSGRYG